MAPSLQLMHFDPAAAFLDDLAAGTQKRLVFYRAVAVDAADDDGMTMLSHAARVGDCQAVNVLLERGADPNWTDRSGLTPLMRLASGPRNWQEHPEAVDGAAAALLLAGADVDAKDASGRTAAFIAVEQMLYPFFTALASVGVKTGGRQGSTGFTLLHALCSALHRLTGLPLEQAMKEESDALAIAMILVDKLGVDPNAKSAIGKTARELAVVNQSRLVAPWLAYGDGAFSDKDDLSRLKLATGGATACEAAALGDAAKIRALIALGAAPDEPAFDGDQMGLTPLSCAASVMAVEVMSLLLDAGADPAARINGKARGGRDAEGTSAMRMLLWAPQSPVSLPSGRSADDWGRALCHMLRHPEAANAPVDADGLTPLLTLAQNIGRGWQAGGEKWAELATSILLENGADPNLRMSAKGIDRPFCRIPGGITALGLLALNGSEDARAMARLLLQGGADPNLADKTGRTPLMAAAGLASPSDADAFAELLLDAGADAACRDENARTALDAASAAGNSGVVEKLLSAAAKLEAEDEPDAPQEAMAPTSAQPAGKAKESSPSSSFFERIRKGGSKDSAEMSSILSKSTPVLKGTTFAAPRANAFFDRIRRGAAAREPLPPHQESAAHSGFVDRMRRPPDPFGPVRAMADFLGAVLHPLPRGEIEREMLALGLLAEGGAQDPDALARRTADLLISLNMAAEVDWKAEGEDFCSNLEGLVNFGPVRGAGFETIPIDVQSDDDVPSLARQFDAVSKQWGWPVRLAALKLDADAYIFLLMDSLHLAPARRAAQRAGLQLLDPIELN